MGNLFAIVGRLFLCPALFFALFSFQAHAETYYFAKIADSDSLGISAITTAPVIDGDFVVFMAQVPPGVVGELWSYQLSTRALRKLVDLNTTAPGGVGNFSDLNAGFGGPVLRDEMVVFGAADQSTAQYKRGIYTVPAAGGQIRLIANHGTLVPGFGVPFEDFESNNQPAGNFSISDDVVVFQGSFANGAKNGIFTAAFDGTNLTRLADSDHPLTPPPFPVSDFHNPTIFGNHAAFIGGTEFGPYGIYSSILPGSPGASTLLVNNSTGGSELPVLGTQFSFGPPATALQLHQGVLAFSASGTGARFGHSGIFTVPAAGGAISSVVTDYDIIPAILPRVSPGTDAILGGFAFDSGQVLFNANDATAQSQALFLAKNGLVTKVISNDQLTPARNALGFPIYDLGRVQPGALSAGRLVFAASSLFGPRGSVYLAVPGSQTCDLEVSLVRGTVFALLGEQLTYQFAISNIAAAPATGVTMNVQFPSANLNLVSSSVTGSTGNGTFDAVLGTIPAGSTTTVTLVFKATSIGTPSVKFAVNSATIDSLASNNNSSASAKVTTSTQVARNLLANATTVLKTARLTLPAKPSKHASTKVKNAINARRQLILTARTNFKNLIGQIVSTQMTSGLSIQSTLKHFTSSNMRKLTRSTLTALSKPSSKNWSVVEAALKVLKK